jgi:hypothetical protein
LPGLRTAAGRPPGKRRSGDDEDGRRDFLFDFSAAVADLAVVGQGLDRLLDGRMSLWEHGCIVYGWNDRQPKDGQADDGAPVPTAEDWARLHRNAERATKG